MDPDKRITRAILDVIGQVPKTRETRSYDAPALARDIARAAQRKAAATAATLALPPGPLGWLTVLPELMAVWRIQAQMVADIAGVYGKQHQLSREQMIYCLFRHALAQVARDFVVRVGQRYVVRHVSRLTLEHVAQRLGTHFSRRVLGQAASRWLPLIGAFGVGAYAYFDTGQVAKTAMDLFRHDIERDVHQDEQAS